MPRKKKADRDKGQPVRLSNAVLNVLKKKLRQKESFDSLLRRLLGLPRRNGDAQPLEVFWVLPKTLTIKKTLEEARGEAVLQAVRSGKRKTEAPVKVVEAI